MSRALGAARSRIRPTASAAVAGSTAAAVWAAAEPAVRRVFGTPYTDVRLLGAPLSRRHWRAAGTAVHLANGAVAGLLFHRLGLRGWRQGVAAAVAENTVLWPGMAIVDRLHPDRRSGAWPPLLRNGRVFAQETVVHVLFGAVLGALSGHERVKEAPSRFHGEAIGELEQMPVA